MRSFRRNLIARGLSHPFAVFRFWRETARIRQGNQAHSTKIRELRQSAKTAQQVVSLILNFHDGNPYASTVEKLYLGARDQVFRAYDYDPEQGGGRRPSVIDPGDALILYSLVRESRPDLVIETGVSDGMSSLMILQALQENGHGLLCSIDLPEVGMPAIYGLAPGWLVPAQLRSQWRLFLGDSTALLPGLIDRVGVPDLFFHDSEHSYEAMLREFREVLRAGLRPVGSQPKPVGNSLPLYVCSDDANDNDALIDALSDIRTVQSRDLYDVNMTTEGFGVLSLRSEERRNLS